MKMIHAQEKRKDLDPDVILSLKVFTPSKPRNILTIHSNGRATFQPGFGSSEQEFHLDLGSRSAEEYLQAFLPVEEFLALKEHYYKIPSQRTCGSAANLFLRIGNRENWVGIGNYGRGAIPSSVDANMYRAVLKLEEYLSEG